MIKYLPFRFKQIKNKMLLTNEIGQFIVLEKENFKILLKNPTQLDTEFDMVPF